jgi:hypothetical protein
LLDLLVAGALAIHVVDDFLDQRSHTLVAREPRDVAVDPLLVGPLADLDLVERDQRRDERLAVADDESLGDEPRPFEIVLEVLGCDVLPAGGDDEVLLSVGNDEEAVGVDLADVAGSQPPVL